MTREAPAAGAGAHGLVHARDHAEVARIACDPERFSNAVSRFLQIPNGLDGEEHRRFRALVDRYFTGEALAPFAPACRAVARELAASLPRDRAVDAVRELGAPYAVRATSAWLGWPAALEPTLLAWLDDRLDATRTGEPARNADVAARFDAIIAGLLDARRDSDGSRDVTDRLLHDTSLGRPLRDEEVVSILRNWTGGDLATIAQCVGVVLHDLAAEPALDRRLRAEAADEAFDRCLEECLRREDPFTTSRRVATCPVEVAGVRVEAGTRIALDWAAANRDARVFTSADASAPERHADANLVYGIGPHVCPGRPLARLQLRELVRALHSVCGALTLAGPPAREPAPLGGYREVRVWLAVR